MDIYRLGQISWWESQCYYHALAYLGREGIILCSPSEPYVCLGLHDDLEQEIDQEYCRRQRLPLLRRETGGGVVCLDRGQLFYQVILHRDNPILPLPRIAFFSKVLQPAIDLYRSLGLDAVLAPPADIQVDGRKCSGNGAGDIGPCTAYVGNILMDFDFEMMSRVLKLPIPACRPLLCESMKNHMHTLSDKKIHVDETVLEKELIRGFQKQFGDMNYRAIDEATLKMAVSLKMRLTSKSWLRKRGRRSALRKIKIAEGIYLQEKSKGDHHIVLTLTRDNGGSETTLMEYSTLPQLKLKAA